MKIRILYKMHRLKNKISFSVVLVLLPMVAAASISYPYKTISMADSAKRPLPQWFSNAKLGIFIHWGLYSVPAWATPTTTPDKVTDWKEFYRSNPYAEWYLNSLRIQGSPTQQYHTEKYGNNFNYYNFGDSLIKRAYAWDAAKWVELFAKCGARYIVFTTKHHDGYTMFPSKVPNPFMDAAKINSARDFTGELCRAARERGLKFGTYYSGGLDWTFNQEPVTNLWPDLFESMPQSTQYADYADAHLLEIIRNYAPDILWNDVNYPKNGNLPGIVGELLRVNPQAVVNDRWQQHPELADFTTPEYQVMDSIVAKKWETCRGIGYSFGYNRAENDKQLLSSNELILLLIDIVSKSGNLLLNIGPAADGSIPGNQLQRLTDLGRWLQINGEGIFDTEPWRVPNQILSNGAKIFFTQKNNTLYIFFSAFPPQGTITIPGLSVTSSSRAWLTGKKETKVKMAKKGNGVTLKLPRQTGSSIPFMVKVVNTAGINN